MILFHEMTINGMIPNVVTYTTLIGRFCQVGRPKIALELLHEMQVCGHVQISKLVLFC
jgi:pentatricopeptide repeat protein